MGTRASFWIGDPRDLSSREWLGCKAWDGYPDNRDFAGLLRAKDEAEFRIRAASLIDAKPSGGWPYPWADDVFLTDFTYAFMHGQVYVAHYHYGFVPWSVALDEEWEWPDADEPSMRGVPAPKGYDPSQPDSILIFRG